MAVDPRLLDEVAAAATAATFDHEIDRWWCKASPDLPFRRASAVLPAPDAGADPVADERALDRVIAWYDEVPLPVLVQVSEALADAAALDAALCDRGWTREAPVHILVRSVDGVTADGPRRAPGAATVVGVDEEWAATHALLDGGDEAQRVRAMGYGRLLSTLGDRAIGATMAAASGQAAGVGFAILDGPTGGVGIYGMATSPSHRRRGVASSILEALLAQAGAAGATIAYLQVEAGNDEAHALYDAFGFTLSHRYHYRRRGA